MIAIVLSLFLVFVGAFAAAPPSQLHLHMGNADGSQMRAMWTLVDTPIASAPPGLCNYGTSPSTMSKVATATVHTYNPDGFQGTIYSAVMIDLPPGLVRIYYTCGSSLGKTPVNSFQTAPTQGPEATETVGFLQYGDMGTVPTTGWLGDDPTGNIKHMTRDMADPSGKYSLVIDVGDSSYADDHLLPNSHIEDMYWAAAAGFSSNAPIMLCPGNHEAQFDFAAHLNRTMMPVQGTGPRNRFYSAFEWGPVRFITYTTEFEVEGEQQNFVESALRATNRTRTPWVIAFTHHPMYCSSLIYWSTRCKGEAEYFRSVFEPMFLKYGVDVHFSGHNHQYERSWPVANGTVVQHGYDANKGGVTYIVNGAGGNIEHIDPTHMPDVPFVAFHGSDFNIGYLRATANRNQLNFEYVRGDTGAVVDHFSMTR